MLIPFHRLPRLALILIALLCATVAHAYPKGDGSGAGAPAGAAAMPPSYHYQDPEAAALRARMVEDGGALIAMRDAVRGARDGGGDAARAWSGAWAEDEARTALLGHA